MRIKTLLTLTTMISLALTLGLLLVSGIYLTGQVQAQEPPGEVGPQALTGTAFTYQGRLLRGTSLVSGTCDLSFKLYGSSGGSDLLGTVNKSSVSVSNGYLAEMLDFGNLFDGGERWLEITINSCSDGSGSGTLSPRVALSPAPYALGLRPGATISGSATALTVKGTTTGLEVEGSTYGLDAAATGTSGAAVRGLASNGTAVGVVGFTGSSSNFASGVEGHATALTGQTRGVYGFSNSSNGVGVYGQAGSPGGYGLYSDGNTHIDGQLTWKTITSYLSIPAAAFEPYDNYTYQSINNGLEVQNSDSNADYHYAPAFLPHQATVIGLTFYWGDTDSSNDAQCRLDRSTMNGVSDFSLAGAASSGSAGHGASSGTCSGSICVVDNTLYGYMVSCTLPTNTTSLYNVVISYTVSMPY